MPMTTTIVSRAEWLAARRRLLAKEKEATRARDALAAERRALPMVEIEKEYAFQGPDGVVTLPDLFDGRRQLIVHHVMWLFDTDEGCPSCSLRIDDIGNLAHLHACDTSLVLVSRAPFASIERFRNRMGWTIPWYSSFGSDFNHDFHVTSDETRGPVMFNYDDKATLERKGIGFWAANGMDTPGLSVFLRGGERVLHTYSTFARGLEPVMGTYNHLDLTPLGRQRDISEFPHRDRYGRPSSHHHHE
jgi:predicted dithiol-disulfide oxidoreductase (DUF899 family)